MALPEIWLKKRVVVNGDFKGWNIKAVPGEWAIPDNATTPSKLQLDFLDPRAGWEKATPEEIAQEQTRLAQLDAATREKQMEKRVNEVVAQQAAVETVMAKVEEKKKLAEKPAPASKREKIQ